MLFYINETNLERKNKKMQKQEKGRESPQGGWGMGSKDPIPKMILFIIDYRISALKLSKTSWSLYRLKPRSYNFAKNLRF